MEEVILKDDPLKRPKMITVASVIVTLAVLMFFTFASFHWICADYFNFKANEGEARKQLEDARSRYAVEEVAAKQRQVEIEERTKALEAEAVQKAKIFEAEAQTRIQDLEKEFSDKRAAKLVEHQKFADELDASLKAKKADLAVLLRGFKERFDAKTNDFEVAISEKEAELQEIKRMILILPDVKGQLSVASNALISARSQRDAALDAERASQEMYGKWNAKVEAAQARLGELEARRDAIAKELESLAQTTNTVRLATVALQGQLQAVQGKVAATQEMLQTVQRDVKTAEARLEGVNAQVAAAEKRRQASEASRVEADAALSAALDKRREAESKRDKAQMEASQAEAHWAKRKPEIEGLIKAMERILEMKSESVRTAAEKPVAASDGKKDGDLN